MSVYDLHEKFAQVGKAGVRAGLIREMIDGVAEHARGEFAGFKRHLRAGNAAVTLADQAITQSMEPGRLAEQRFTAFDALVEWRKEAKEPDHPEIEVGDGHPNGG